MYELADRVVVVDAGRAGPPMDVAGFRGPHRRSPTPSRRSSTPRSSPRTWRARMATRPRRRATAPVSERRRLAHRRRHRAGRSPTSWPCRPPARSACARSAPPRASRPPAVFEALERTDLDLAAAVDYFVLGHDDRHERGPPARGRPDALHHDRRLRGHPLHPAHRPQGPLRPPVGEGASRTRRATTRSGVRERILADGVGAHAADRRRGRARRRGRRGEARRRPGRRGRDQLPVRVRRTRSTSGASPTPLRAAYPGGARVGLARGRADLARVRAQLDDGHGRVREAHRRALRRRTSSRASPSGASAAGTRSCARTAARSRSRHAADAARARWCSPGWPAA